MTEPIPAALASGHEPALRKADRSQYRSNKPRRAGRSLGFPFDHAGADAWLQTLYVHDRAETVRPYGRRPQPKRTTRSTHALLSRSNIGRSRPLAVDRRHLEHVSDRQGTSETGVADRLAGRVSASTDGLARVRARIDRVQLAKNARRSATSGNHHRQLGAPAGTTGSAACRPPGCGRSSESIASATKTTNIERLNGDQQPLMLLCEGSTQGVQALVMERYLDSYESG